MIGVFIVALPILTYLAVALGVDRREASNPANFYTAHRKANVTVFSTSSVAYAFQMSTIFPFLIWGASGFFFVPLINSVCWGIGILFFHLALRRPNRFIQKDQTLHGLLGDKYGQSVRKVASCLTILGFFGFIVAELYFGSQVILALAPHHRIIYALIVTVSVLVYAYVAYGGQLSSMRTDQLQLAISYIGFFGIILYFLCVIRTQKIALNRADYIALLACAMAIPAILLRRKGRFVSFSFGGQTGDRISRVLNTVIVLVLLGIVGVEIAALPKAFPQHPSGRFFDLTGFGLPGLLSLVILPLCFQFVDLTNWQRLLAIKATADSETALSSAVARGLLIYAVESPFTWLISLLFGLLAAKVITGLDVNDLLVDLPRKLLHSAAPFDHVVAYIFILSVISVMLSTVDSFMIGILYTFVYDSYGPTQRIADTHNQHLIQQNSRLLIRTGRWFGAASLSFAIGTLALFDRALPSGGELFINLLLSFYSAQLSFLPLVLGNLYLKRQPTRNWANASMLLGAASGILLGIYAVIWNSKYAWHPILVCLFVSCGIYLLGLGLSPRKLRQA